MKTYLEWHYDELPTEPGEYYAAIQYIGGSGNLIGRTVKSLAWEGVWKTDMWRKTLPDNQVVYAWAYKNSAVPPVDIDKE